MHLIGQRKSVRTASCYTTEGKHSLFRYLHFNNARCKNHGSSVLNHFKKGTCPTTTPNVAAVKSWWWCNLYTLCFKGQWTLCTLCTTQQQSAALHLNQTKVRSTLDFALLQKVWHRAAGFDIIYRKLSSSNCRRIIPHLTYQGGCVTSLYMAVRGFFFFLVRLIQHFFYEVCTQFNFQSLPPKTTSRGRFDL